MSHEPENFLQSADTRFIAELYLRYLESPQSLDPAWQSYFQSLGDQASNLVRDVKGASWAEPLPSYETQETGKAQPASGKSSSGKPSGQSSAPRADKAAASPAASAADMATHVAFVRRADALVQAYRAYGHTAVMLDPLGLQVLQPHAELDVPFSAQEAQTKLPVTLGGNVHELTLAQLQQTLQTLYCGSIGFEYMHIRDPRARLWLQQAIETSPSLSAADQAMILQSLTQAEGFENFLKVKFPTAKRFGLEGGESLMPLLECVLDDAATSGYGNVIIGMAHRGRLNVQTHIMGKPYADMLSDFIHGIAMPDGLPEGFNASLDVKYHAGRSHDRKYEGGPLHLSLLPNPSHLEMANPVVQGKVRAKQTRAASQTGALGLLIHGDAAFAGQGIVMESLMLSGLPGYTTGGTFHIVINNQVGFTTDPTFSRSSLYCTDIGKMIDAPVLHVNGDDPEAVVRAGRLAALYRREFGSDVIIDLVCYRRHGHNEMDEPAFTQPRMYSVIAQHPTTRQIYAKALVARGVITEKDAEQKLQKLNQDLQQAFQQASKAAKHPQADWLQAQWSQIDQTDANLTPETGVDPSVLQNLGQKLCDVPESFSLNAKIQRQLEQRQAMLNGREGLDWGMGEALAFATLLHEGYHMRLAGQDSGRGTFTHRHSVWTDQKTQQRYVPLQQLSPNQGRCEIIDSPLSELAALGYELGYAMDDPKTLVMWEGQFGDFANGAQVMVDQFLSSSEMKWLRVCGLTLLLPHGFEGQGPEHSSARLERFLQLCADNNLRVVNCTTPANQFHVLRRQMLSKARKPLVSMTPKSLLRLKAAKSPLADFIAGTTFQSVLFESLEAKHAKDVQRVVVCSGKIYYDLLEARTGKDAAKVALIRLEQLYPFPEVALQAALKPLSRKAEIVWCQEEPRNMGAWTYVREEIDATLTELKFDRAAARYVGRRAAASPAVGSDKRHAQEQAALVQEALSL